MLWLNCPVLLKNFEIKNEVSSSILKADRDKILNYFGIFEEPYNKDWALLFAYDEYMDRINTQGSLVENN